MLQSHGLTATFSAAIQSDRVSLLLTVQHPHCPEVPSVDARYSGGSVRFHPKTAIRHRRRKIHREEYILATPKDHYSLLGEYIYKVCLICVYVLSAVNCSLQVPSTCSWIP